MSQFDTKKTRTLHDLDDDALEGAGESPPLLMLLFGLVEIMWGVFTNCVQVTTSAMAFLSTAQTQAVINKSVQELFALTPKLAIMALVVAGGVQIIVLMGYMPMSSVWRRLRHVQLTKVNTLHAGQEVIRHLNARHALIIVAFIGNVIGDIRFATMFTHDYVLVGLWVILLTASSTLVFFDGWQRVWGALQSWKDYRYFREERYGESKK